MTTLPLKFNSPLSDNFPDNPKYPTQDLASLDVQEIVTGLPATIVGIPVGAVKVTVGVGVGATASATTVTMAEPDTLPPGPVQVIP